MRNAVIYARYSSDKQTEQSIEGQVRICREYAERNDYHIIEVYADRATTGRNDQRAEFQRMLKDSEQHRFEAVIVYKLDRFARNRYDSAYNKNILKKNGARLISAMENISDNPEGILLESLVEGLAEYYSAELAQKVTRGMKESILKGHWLGGRVPYGYNIVEKKYEINEVEAQVVRLMFELYKKHQSVQVVVDEINSRHILNKQNCKFKYTQIRKILSRDLYIGTIRASGLVLEDKVPPIVSKEIFYEVNKLLNNNVKHIKGQDFILTGKLFCGDCGQAMTGTSGTGRSKTYYYYQCKHDKHKISREKIEDFVFNALKNFLSNEDNFKWISETIDKQTTNNDNSYLESLHKRLRKVETELANISNAIISGIINDDLKAKNDELRLEQQELKFEIEKNEHNKLLSGQIVAEFLKSMSNSIYEEDKPFLIKALVNKVIYTKEKTTIILNLSPRTTNIGKNEIIEFIGGSTDFSVGLPNKTNPCKSRDFLFVFFFLSFSFFFFLLSRLF